MILIMIVVYRISLVEAIENAGEKKEMLVELFIFLLGYELLAQNLHLSGTIYLIQMRNHLGL